MKPDISTWEKTRRLHAFVIAGTLHAILLLLLGLIVFRLERPPVRPPIAVRMLVPPPPARPVEPAALPRPDVPLTTLPDPPKGREVIPAPQTPEKDPGRDEEMRRPADPGPDQPARPTPEEPVAGVGRKPPKPETRSPKPTTSFPDRKAWEEYWKPRLPENIDALRLPEAVPLYEGYEHQRAVAAFFGEREAVLIPKGGKVLTILVDRFDPLEFREAPPDFNPGFRDYARGAIHRANTPFEKRYGPAVDLIATIHGADPAQVRDRRWLALMPRFEFGYHARKVLDALAAADLKPDDPDVARVWIAYPKTPAGFAEIVVSIEKKDGTLVPVKDPEAP
ncbi:MAG: hypothetical protein AAB215_03020 [Planctomycetota bacterium]